GAEIWVQALANRGKNQESSQSDPEKIPRFGRLYLQPEPSRPRPVKEFGEAAAASSEAFFDAAAHAFEERRDVEEIVRRRAADFLGQSREIGRKRQRARPQQAREQQNPRTGEAKRQVVKDAV